MIRWIRGAVFALSVVTSLACAGIGEKMLEWTGSEIAVGENAVHPADFPMPPPPGGKLLTTAKVNLGGMDTTTVVYQVQGSDTEALLKPYETVMTEAGLAIQRSDVDNTHSISGTGTDKSQWSAVLTDSNGERSLTLLVVKM